MSVYGSFRGFHLSGSAGLHFDEAKNVVIPSDQVDLAATEGRTKIPSHDQVAKLSKMKVGVFLTAPPDLLVHWADVTPKYAPGKPIQPMNDAPGANDGKHENDFSLSL